MKKGASEFVTIDHEPDPTQHKMETGHSGSCAATEGHRVPTWATVTKQTARAVTRQPSFWAQLNSTVSSWAL